jgi:methionine-rich copper-binding protein CopC
MDRTSMQRPTGQHARHHARLGAVSAGAAIAALVILLAPQPAAAHAALVSSSPSDGDVVASVPTEVSFTFDEGLGSPAFVSVVGPDGADIADGDAVVDGATVTQAVRLLPEQGRYTASYRVVSDDGHPVTGTIRFTVDPVNGTTAPSSPTLSDCAHGCPLASARESFWHRESTWVVIALAALALAIATVFAFGLRSGAGSSDLGGDG